MEPIRRQEDLRTPCFILDRAELERSILGFQTALKQYFRDSMVSYSVKTNSTPYCLGIARENGVYAEVVSHDEYELALKCGFPKSDIVYNGPMKSRETFQDAVWNGAYVNIETKRELEWLAEMPKDRAYKVGIRLNVNLSVISPEDGNGPDDNSRFGFSDETEEFSDAVKRIGAMPNIELAGLHIHRTSHTRSVGFYRNSIRYACEIIRKYALHLDYLDVGGGYFGIFQDKPTYRQYCECFHDVLLQFGLENLKLIVEPGNALVASAFKFLCEVIDVKHVEPACWFITTDGSRNDVDPFFRKTSYLEKIQYFKPGEMVGKQVISGCTCLENDRMFVLNDRPLLNPGDRILFNNVGAYTMCLSPLFIRYLPAVYLKESQGYSLIREPWTAEEFIQKSKIKI